jgi:hypothetical protein
MAPIPELNQQQVVFLGSWERVILGAYAAWFLIFIPACVWLFYTLDQNQVLCVHRIIIFVLLFLLLPSYWISRI